MGSTDSTGKPFDLDHQLATCIEEYDEGRLKYWAQRPDGADWGLQKRLYGQSEQLAQMLLKQTSSLTGSADLASEAFAEERKNFFRSISKHRLEITDILRSKLGAAPFNPVLRAYLDQVGADARPDDDSLLKLVWERLMIVLAGDFTGSRLARGANRMLRLLEVVIEAQPSEPTLKFLTRVSRCYVFGLDSECVILCRGAIDTAFNNVLPDRKMDQLGVRPETRYGYTLAQRIRTARDTGVIDDDDVQAAERVKGTANEATHEDPDVTNVFAIVRDALRVIQRLGGTA